MASLSSKNGRGNSREIHELIRKMHRDLKKKIRSCLEMSLSEPNSDKVLINELSGLRSLRVSSFRVIYGIKPPEQIELVAIGSSGHMRRLSASSENRRLRQRKSGMFLFLQSAL
jgi:mRNA-degrading endonuclease RelE of RelBE toxin-antitoxin system